MDACVAVTRGCADAWEPYVPHICTGAATFILAAKRLGRSTGWNARERAELAACICAYAVRSDRTECVMGPSLSTVAWSTLSIKSARASGRADVLIDNVASAVVTLRVRLK